MARERGSHLAITAVRSGDSQLTLLLVGELDIAVADRVLAATFDVLDRPDVTEVVVDLSRTSFLDARGAFTLARAHNELAAAGRRLTLAGARGIVAEVLYLTDVLEALGVPLRLGTRPHEGRESLGACGRRPDEDGDDT